MTGPKVVAARWLLLCVLAFGMVGMHHFGWVSHQSDTHVVAMKAPDCCAAGEEPTPMHHLLHLCLAVLAATLLLAAMRWCLPSRRAAPGHGPVPRERPPPAPPDLTSSLGVLRL